MTDNRRRGLAREPALANLASLVACGDTPCRIPLCVDEVGYLSFNSRYADLLFQLVTRRYDAGKPVLLSTNKAFSGWNEVLPHAACVVTLVDRLSQRAEVIDIEADSYHLEEAKGAHCRSRRAQEQGISGFRNPSSPFAGELHRGSAGSRARQPLVFARTSALVAAPRVQRLRDSSTSASGEQSHGNRR